MAKFQQVNPAYILDFAEKGGLDIKERIGRLPTMHALIEATDGRIASSQKILLEQLAKEVARIAHALFREDKVLKIEPKDHEQDQIHTPSAVDANKDTIAFQFENLTESKNIVTLTIKRLDGEHVEIEAGSSASTLAKNALRLDYCFNFSSNETKTSSVAFSICPDDSDLTLLRYQDRPPQKVDYQFASSLIIASLTYLAKIN